MQVTHHRLDQFWPIQHKGLWNDHTLDLVSIPWRSPRRYGLVVMASAPTPGTMAMEPNKACAASQPPIMASTLGVIETEQTELLLGPLYAPLIHTSMMGITHMPVRAVKLVLLSTPSVSLVMTRVLGSE